MAAQSGIVAIRNVLHPITPELWPQLKFREAQVRKIPRFRITPVFRSVSGTSSLLA
jgi:hypothetical protein